MNGYELTTDEHELQAAAAALHTAQEQLREATEALIHHAETGWDITPLHVAKAQRRYDEAVDSVVARATYRGQVYERVSARV